MLTTGEDAQVCLSPDKLSLVLRSRVKHDPLIRRYQNADVRNDMARVEFDLDFVAGLAHLNTAPDP